MVIYNAPVMNDGKPQHFFDHTAHLTILTLKSRFRLAHGMACSMPTPCPQSRSRATQQLTIKR
jgi:hypothetical protein